MERMGIPAALIYQHATRERDDAIAAGMGKLLKQARKAKGGGSQARNWHGPASKRPDREPKLDDHVLDLAGLNRWKQLS